MTILIEGEDSFILSSHAHLINDEIVTASEWASTHIKPNPAIKWIVGNYVEADRENRNKHYWSYEDLRASKSSVDYAPLNILHRPKHVVGTFAATEMIYPTETAAANGEGRPYLEALAAFWKAYFPEELGIIEMAHNQGSLYFSMECISEKIHCTGDNGCEKEFAYAGVRHPSYCSHLNENVSTKHLVTPHFLAGALIFPPTAPGWGNANINSISSLMEKYEDQIPGIYEAIKADDANLSELEIEELVVEHVANVEVMEKKKKDPKKLGKKYAAAYLLNNR